MPVALEYQVVEHLRARGLTPQDAPLAAEPLPGGVSSDVLAVSGGGLDVVVKRALPQLRVAQKWLADEDRIVTEARALQLVGGLAPDLVPAVCDFDGETRTLVMERAPAGWTNWRDDLLRGTIDERIGCRLGEALAIWHRETSLPGVELTHFLNVDNFVQLRIDPFHRTVARRHPALTARLDSVVERLLTTKTCLVHGDFSPKNVLVGNDRLWVLDWEVAHVGDPVFDVAFLLTHLLLKTVKRPAQADAYRAVAGAFLDAYTASPLADESVVENVGCLLLARVDGKSPAPYLTEADALTVRALGAELLLDPSGTALDVWKRLA